MLKAERDARRRVALRLRTVAWEVVGGARLSASRRREQLQRARVLRRTVHPLRQVARTGPVARVADRRLHAEREGGALPVNAARIVAALADEARQAVDGPGGVEHRADGRARHRVRVVGNGATAARRYRASTVVGHDFGDGGGDDGSGDESVGEDVDDDGSCRRTDLSGLLVFYRQRQYGLGVAAVEDVRWRDEKLIRRKRCWSVCRELLRSAPDTVDKILVCRLRGK